MSKTTTDQTSAAIAYHESSDGSLGQAQRAFSLSMLVSGVRCALVYVALPFVTPLLGIAPGVGPVLGIAISTVAIAANVFSLRRFWRINHRWRRPIAVLHISVIGFLLVLIALDIAELVGRAS
ncbi:MAG: hypothetical protein O7D28_04130 [Actinobacteria bacterium]|nr:hypothetical protein [Actinomycetota bacterium]